MSGQSRTETTPAIPRRLFLSAGLAGLAAGGAVWLAVLGQATAPATESFRFSRGTTLGPGEADRLRAHLLPAARDDRIMVTITGHSGTDGDAAANRELSLARAELATETARDLGIPASRIAASGIGGGVPLPQGDGESARAWQSRLARVDVSLQVRR